MNRLNFVRIGLPLDPDDELCVEPDAAVISQLMTRIHRSAGDVAYAVSFPEMREGSQDNGPSLGKTLLVFSDNKEGLAQILDAVTVRRLLRDCCEVSPIRPVPPNLIMGWESYIRDRSADKLLPSRQARALRRQQSGISNSSAMRASERKCRPLPFFVHMSLSTADEEAGPRNVRIYIRRAQSKQPTGFKFGSFGLTGASGFAQGSVLSAVPILRGINRGEA